MIARAAADQPPPGRADSIVACTVGDEQFALRGADAREIVRAEAMRRFAGADGSVGALYVGRDRVPVYPLAAVLRRPGATGGGNHVVITNGSAGMAGWLVDRIARPALSEATHVIPLPPIVGSPANRWFEGLVRIGDHSLLLFSPPNLDPRGPAAQAADEPSADAFPGVPGRDESGSPLVLLFSSPALPDCHTARFALSARQVAAVIRRQPLTRVPGCARHVAGVIVWRDAAVPVIDGRQRGERPAATEHDRLVIARCGGALNGALVGFPIGADVALHAPTRADRHVNDDEVRCPPFVAGVFNVAGHAVALLDLDAAVAALAE